MSAAYRDSSGKGLVCGIGIYEPRVLCMRDSPEIERAYRAWNGMLRRTEPKYAEKYPTYAGTTVAEEFVRFHDFARWAMNEPGWFSENAQLDKDLLIKGNRIYSPSTCTFLPKTVNVMLTRANKSRTSLPIGVKESGGGKYIARAKIGGKTKSLGSFVDPIAAFNAYKAAKEDHIRYIAETYRLDIAPAAYQAIMDYKVEITD